MRIFLTIVMLSLVACSDRDSEKLDAKQSVTNTPVVSSGVMTTSSVIAASEVSSVSGITAASSLVRAPGWLDVVQLEEFRQDIEDAAPLGIDCAAERDDEVPPTIKTKKERNEYKRSKQKEYNLELKKCATLQNNLDAGTKLAIADFNRTWIPILKHAVELGDPVAEVILRKCDTALILDRTGIASDCSNNEADSKFAQTRFDAINTEFHNTLNCNACNEFGWFDLLKKHAGAPASSVVVISAVEEAKRMPEAVINPEMIRIPGKNYEMGKYDVTQAEWRAVMGKNPSRFRGCGDTCPVEYVSWNDIQAFLTKLNQKTGKQYRLPTEEEWEYACYGGSPTQYCGSDNPDRVAWYDKNSNSTTHPVGQKQANGYGLYDMIGNVRQWMQNWAQNEDGNRRAFRGGSFRGGSWSDGTDYLSDIDHDIYPPDERFISIGFRLARTLP